MKVGIVSSYLIGKVIKSVAIDPDQLRLLSALFDFWLWDLHQCNAALEQKLDDDQQALINPGGVASDADSQWLTMQLQHLDSVVGQNFRFAMFIGVCTSLEEMLKMFAEHAIPDFKAKLTANWKKKGSGLKKTIGLLKSEAAVSVDPKLEQTIDDLWTVRNAIAHAGGNTLRVKNAAPLHEAVGCLRIGDEQVIDDVGGTLDFSDAAVPLAITTAMELRDALLRKLTPEEL